MGNKEQNSNEQTPLLTVEEQTSSSSCAMKTVNNNATSSATSSNCILPQTVDYPHSHHTSAKLDAPVKNRQSLLLYAYDLSKKICRVLPTIAVVSLIWFGAKPTEELTVTAIHILAVFVGCIVALITTSFDISVLVFTSLTLLALTQSFQCQTTSGNSIECRLCHEAASNPSSENVADTCIENAFDNSLKGFASPVVWLIFAAFHLGKAVEVTFLGKRISLHLIRLFGRKGVLGLAYAIILSELILAPFVPSNTARGGGIVLPIVQSMAQALIHVSSASLPLPSISERTANTYDIERSVSAANSMSHRQQYQKVGGFLMLVGSHANLLSASMYMTGMAPNPIVIAKANALYPDLNFNFVTWITGSSIPALCCAITLPWLLAWVTGVKTLPLKWYQKKKTPEDEVCVGSSRIKNSDGDECSDDSDLEGRINILRIGKAEDSYNEDEGKGKGRLCDDSVFLRSSFTPEEHQQHKREQAEDKDIDIVQHATQQLKDMGYLSLKEKQLCLILLACLLLWVTSAYTHLNSTLVAFIGLVCLLHMRTIQWGDVAHNTAAWETLFWLGGFVTMANQLSNTGASTYLGHQISQGISHMNLSPVPALATAYFLTTFLFSSLSAHTVAFVATFLDAGKALGVTDPKILTCLLAYFGALGGCMTSFSTGSVAMYFATGYVSRLKWFLVGSLVALFYLFVYFTIGMGWWTILGWTNQID